MKIQPSEVGYVTTLGRIDMIFIVFLSFPPARHLPARALQWQAGRSRSGPARRTAGGEAGGGGSTKTQCRLKVANESQTYRFPLKAVLGRNLN